MPGQDHREHAADIPRTTSGRRRARTTAGSSSASELIVIMLGFGLFLGWQIVWISPTLFPPAAQGTPELIARLYYPQSIVYMALLACLGYRVYRRGMLGTHVPTVLVPTFLACLGTALEYLCGWGIQLIPLGVAMGALIISCKAMLVILWGEALCTVRFRYALLTAAGAFCVCFAVCLTVANLGAMAAMVWHVTVPCISGFLLYVVRRERLTGDDAPVGAGETSGTMHTGAADAGLAGIRTSHVTVKPSMAVKLFVGTGVFGGVLALTNTLSESKSTVSTELYSLVGCLVVALVVLTIGYLLVRRPANFILLYRLIAPLLIGCLLLVIVLQPGAQRYEALAIGGSWAAFRIFTWALWIYIATRLTLPHGVTFAIGELTVSFFSMMAAILTSIAPLRALPLVGVAAAIIFITVITSTLLMSENILSRFVGSGHDDEDARSEMTPEQMATLEAHCVDLATQEFELSARESEIALMVLQGHDNGYICEHLFVAESTLRTHLRNIYGKCSIHSRGELIELMRSYG